MMKEMFKKYFALTEQGAGDLVKATFASLSVYIINMFPLILLMLIADGLILGNTKSGYLYIVLYVVILIAMYILLSIQYDSLYNATYKESANLRIQIVEILKELPLSYFSKHDVADISQTVMSDVEAVEHAMSHAMAMTAGFFIFFPIFTALLLWGNVFLGLAVILPVLLNFILIWLSKKMQLRENLKYYKKLRDNSDYFQETIELQQDIKSFGLSEKIKCLLYKKMEESERMHIKAELMAFIPVAFAGLILQLSLAVVIITGITLYAAGQVTILYLIGYILAAMKLKESADGVNQNIAELFYLDARINRIKEIRETEMQKGEDTELSGYDIVFKNVSFSYDGRTKVLDDVSFKAAQNEVTALVGRSGCGKTSILRLVSRLYDYDGGTITIGGKDIKRLSTKALFEKISIVFQDVTLFNTSIAENIRIGKKDASYEEIKNAARLANCEEFINKLPDGYETVIGENGALLSGGERQRLSIARAFLKDAPIIILDEIAAALDVDNEKKIQDSLNKLIKGKTVLIISHRLKSVENADRIVVIDNGKTDACGKHDDLIRSSKVYASLVYNARLAEDFVY